MLFLMGQVEEDQRKGLLRRPMTWPSSSTLIFAAFFTLFRGLVSLHWPGLLACSPSPPFLTSFSSRKRPLKFTEPNLSVPSQRPIPCSFPSSSICGFSEEKTKAGAGQSRGPPPRRVGEYPYGRDV